VSTLSRSSTATIPVWTVKLCIRSILIAPVADIDKTPRDSSGSGHGGAPQVGASACALPAFKVAIAGGKAAPTRFEPVRVHAQAHGAAGLAPFEAGVGKDAVQAFLFCGVLHLLRSRHDHRLHAAGNPIALHHASRAANVLQTSIGARADKHAVDGD